MEGRDLDAAVEALAAQLAERVVGEARTEAIADACAEVSGRLTVALLRHCEAEPARAGASAEQSAGRAAAAGQELPSERAAPSADAATGSRVAAGPPPEPVAPARRPDPLPPEPVAPARRPTSESSPAPFRPLTERVRREATGRYVYGVVRAGTTLPGDLAGVEPTARVRLIKSRGLAALVSDVPLSEFDDTSLRENLDDVAWLEEKARAHEEVLEAALAETAVVPLRLCTFFAGEEQVAEMLGREYGVLLDALERLAGRAEWGVRAYVDRGTLEREALRRARQDEVEDDEDAGTGTAYVNRRRAAAAREGAEQIAEEWAREIHHQLAAVADEALLNPLQPREPSGRGGEMLLNGVYLIADEGASDFRSAVRVLAEGFERRAVEVVLTGPWPAYNFVKSSIEAAR